MKLKRNIRDHLILVTGSIGLLGRNLVTRLTEKGVKVIGCDIKKPDYPIRRGFIFEKCDLTSEREIASLFKKYNFNQIVHLAASYRKFGNLNENEKKEMFQGNVATTFKIISAMEEFKVKRLIFSSSMTVYGLPQYLPVDENHPLNPLDFYGFSKIMSEEIVKNSSVEYLILRFPGIFSLTRKRGAVYNFIFNALQGKDLHISANTLTPWDIISADDAADSINISLASNVKNNIFNIGYGKSIELVRLAKKIVKLCNSKSKVVKDHPVNHPVFYLDTKKARRLLRVSLPSLDFRLEQFINYQKYGK